jgi:DNA-binding MarR family transcriptional regulator
MSFLVEGPQPAGAIAETIGLTPAAVTSLVDRLEARGFVARQRNEADRRQVLVAPTEAATKIGERYYGQTAQEGEAMLDAMSTADLAVVKKFITVALELQQRQIDRIRNDKAKPPAGLKPRR